MKTNGGFLVTKIKQLGDRIFEKILSEKNIDAFNGAQGRILYVLWQEDGISIRSLSTKCGLAITSLTTMLERMENQGLISRVQSETDKRKTLLFLTKRPDLLDFDTDLENAWFGVTVTRKAERWRIDALRKNVRAKHYHVTFEPLFDDPGTVDLSGINWIVVGTMTGAQSRKIHTEPEWAWSLADQADKLGIPVFMKEDLVPIIGDENMIQEMPEEFNKVLEVQKSWKK